MFETASQAVRPISFGLTDRFASHSLGNARYWTFRNAVPLSSLYAAITLKPSTSRGLCAFTPVAMTTADRFHALAHAPFHVHRIHTYVRAFAQRPLPELPHLLVQRRA